MIRKLIISIFLVCLALFIITTGCKPVDEPPDDDDTVMVYGAVRNLKTGYPVAGALVTVGDQSSVTDTSGVYSVTLSGDFENMILNIQSDGYVRFSKPLDENQGDNAKLNAHLMPVDLVAVIDPGEETNIVTTVDGAQVDFPDLSGEGITEDLRVSITHFDVSSDELAAVPGNFMGSDNGETVPIVSQGMIDVVITGEDSGDEYDFNGEGLEFVITLPVTGDPALAEETIDLWWYNADTGLWVQEGVATKTDIDGEDFYVGSVSHFTTWNMDFKMADRVRIHGTINDLEDDYYDITFKGPGFIREFSMNDHDLMILNMIPNVTAELTIVKRSTGYQNVIVFETIPTSGDIVELGDLLSPDYRSFVYDLRVVQDNTGVQFTWTDPTNAKFEGLRINYESTSITVNPGIEQHTFDGLPDGPIEFHLTALYTDGESVTVTRRVRVGEYAELSIELDIDSWEENIILQNYPTVEDWYTLYYKFGNNTGYIEYNGPEMLPVQSMQLMIELDSDELEYEDNGYQYTWYVSTPVWYREDDSTYHYGYDIDIDLDSDEDGDDHFEIYFSGCES